MPAYGRWNLIRRLKFNVVDNSDTSVTSKIHNGIYSQRKWNRLYARLQIILEKQWPLSVKSADVRTSKIKLFKQFVVAIQIVSFCGVMSSSTCCPWALAVHHYHHHHHHPGQECNTNVTTWSTFLWILMDPWTGSSCAIRVLMSMLAIGMVQWLCVGKQWCRSKANWHESRTTWRSRTKILQKSRWIWNCLQQWSCCPLWHRVSGVSLCRNLSSSHQYLGAVLFDVISCTFYLSFHWFMKQFEGT